MSFFFVPIDIMYMYLLRGAFLLLKMAENYQKWVYIGMEGAFF